MMLKKLFISKLEDMSIQWYILLHTLRSTLSTALATVLFILIVSFLFYPWKAGVEQHLGLTLFSKPYFFLLGFIFLCSVIISIPISLWLGFPLGRSIKKSIQQVADATDAFTRGKLDYRLQRSGQDEISHVAHSFNQMADRFEQQVISLQKLVNENSLLIKQAEQAASLDERRKLARDLHDAVSQQLFAVSMTMAALPRLMESNPLKAKEHMQDIENMINMAQQELRALIMHLRPVTLDGQSLSAGIRQLFDELAQKNPNVTFEQEIRLGSNLEHGLEDQLFRIIQEAISNTLRHARASQFRLALVQKDERLLLTLEDNGIGFEPNSQKLSSYGLQTMKERTENIGGRFDVFSIPSHGTRLEIRVPLQGLKKEL